MAIIQMFTLLFRNCLHTREHPNIPKTVPRISCNAKRFDDKQIGRLSYIRRTQYARSTLCDTILTTDFSFFSVNSKKCSEEALVHVADTAKRFSLVPSSSQMHDALDVKRTMDKSRFPFRLSATQMYPKRCGAFFACAATKKITKCTRRSQHPNNIIFCSFPFSVTQYIFFLSTKLNARNAGWLESHFR